MTDEEKQAARDLKKHTATALKRMRATLEKKYKAVFDTDARILDYVCNVIDNPAAHNLYELLAVRRFFYLLSKYSWNAGKYKKFVKFYEAVKFSGTNGRQRYILTPMQCFVVANIYGLYDENGLRLITDATLFLPRKWSKTTFAAAAAVFDMLFGDSNAQAYIGSNSYQQSKICFTEVQNILLSIDPNERHFVVNREMVRFRDKQKESFVRCLTANAKTQDGLFASLVIMDEYSQARNTAGKNGADLKNTLTSSMGPRREPLVITITTASEVLGDAGPFYGELAGVKSVLRGEIENDHIFAAIYEPDVDDDISNPEVWQKCQPHMGVTVRPEFYERSYQNALLSADNMMVFKTKLLNIFAQNEQKMWLNSTLAHDMTRNIKLENITGKPRAMCAFDLSVSDDFSAVSFAIYDKKKKHMHFHTDYFFPEGALEKHPNRKLYEEWAANGFLILTPGPVIDYRVIVAHILKAAKVLKIMRIGYDQYKAKECVNMIASTKGGKSALKAVPQTYGAFTAPVQTFEHEAKTGTMSINDNPINNFCFNNAVLDYDNLENCKPLKISHTRKIDGLITMLMALRLWLDFEE